MGLSLSRKILAKTSGRRSVEPGDFIEVTPDRSMTYDPQGGALHRRVREHWGENARLWDPDRVILVADHFLDRANPVHVERQAKLDAFARAYEVEHYYPVGAANYGICHALLPEEGLIRPGELIAGTDSHSSTYGGFGAIGLNVGIDAMEGILLTGQHWIQVPRELRIEISGRFPEGVLAKDVILKLCADLTNTATVFGAAVELDGEAVQALHPEEKLTIANMAQELGARWLVIPPDEAVCAWVRNLTDGLFEPLLPDKDASYAEVLRYRGEDFEPMVALPGGPERAIPIRDLARTRFNEVFVGSCTGAKRFDMERMFQTLQAAGGVSTGVSLMVVPATRKVREWIFADKDREHLLRIAGVAVATDPGCDACAGLYGFIAGDAAVRMSTANRNYAGRMGAPGAQVFLGSPATAAHVAATGALGR